MDGPRGDGLRRLANYRLETNGLHRLSRSIAAAMAVSAAKPLTNLTLGLISNATTDLIVPALVAPPLATVSDLHVWTPAGGDHPANKKAASRRLGRFGASWIFGNTPIARICQPPFRTHEKFGRVPPPGRRNVVGPNV